MRKEIIEHSRHIVESCFFPSYRALWEQALEAYELRNDPTSLANLFLQELKAFEFVARQMNLDISDVPEAAQVKIILESLGVTNPDTSSVKGIWE